MFDKSKKYTVEEFFNMIDSGELKLSVPIITGRNGAKYKRVPAEYKCNKDDKWAISLFQLYDINFKVVTLITNKGSWFHLSQFLKGSGIAANDNEVSSFIDSLPVGSVRYYSPFNKGSKRAFIKDSCLCIFNFKIDGCYMSKNIVRLEQIESNVLLINKNELRKKIDLISESLKNLLNISFLGDSLE